MPSPWPLHALSVLREPHFLKDSLRKWALPEIYGNLWKSMEIYGNLWKSMEIYGNLWESMGIYGNLWTWRGHGGVDPTLPNSQPYQPFRPKWLKRLR